MINLSLTKVKHKNVLYEIEKSKNQYPIFELTMHKTQSRNDL
jgi:hypothetical protein